jgi:hypothetical protein
MVGSLGRPDSTAALSRVTAKSPPHPGDSVVGVTTAHPATLQSHDAAHASSKEGAAVTDTMQTTEDLAILAKLNEDYIHSDQFNDVKRFSEFLAQDFLIQTPGVTRNREEFLEYIAKPRPFKDLAVHDVNIRILSDVALIHARATYTMLADGGQQDALYTDTYQKRDGSWVCVAACAIAPGA